MSMNVYCSKERVPMMGHGAKKRGYEINATSASRCLNEKMPL
jgi:hypothetical protein